MSQKKKNTSSIVKNKKIFHFAFLLITSTYFLVVFFALMWFQHQLTVPEFSLTKYQPTVYFYLFSIAIRSTNASIVRIPNYISKQYVLEHGDAENILGGGVCWFVALMNILLESNGMKNLLVKARFNASRHPIDDYINDLLVFSEFYYNNNLQDTNQHEFFPLYKKLVDGMFQNKTYDELKKTGYDVMFGFFNFVLKLSSVVSKKDVENAFTFYMKKIPPESTIWYSPLHEFNMNLIEEKGVEPPLHGFIFSQNVLWFVYDFDEKYRPVGVSGKITSFYNRLANVLKGQLEHLPLLLTIQVIYSKKEEKQNYLQITSRDYKQHEFMEILTMKNTQPTRVRLLGFTCVYREKAHIIPVIGKNKKLWIPSEEIGKKNTFEEITRSLYTDCYIKTLFFERDN